MSRDLAGGIGAVWTCLPVDDVEQELKFLESAFQAEVLEKRTSNGNELEYATARVADSVLRLEKKRGADPRPGCELYVWVENVEALIQHALRAGATSIEEPGVRPDGTRGATIMDRNGVTWRLGEKRARPSTKEVERRLLQQRRARL